MIEVYIDGSSNGNQRAAVRRNATMS